MRLMEVKFVQVWGPLQTASKIFVLSLCTSGFQQLVNYICFPTTSFHLLATVVVSAPIDCDSLYFPVQFSEQFPLYLNSLRNLITIVDLHFVQLFFLFVKKRVMSSNLWTSDWKPKIHIHSEGISLSLHFIDIIYI